MSKSQCCGNCAFGEKELDEDGEEYTPDACYICVDDRYDGFQEKEEYYEDDYAERKEREMEEDREYANK